MEQVKFTSANHRFLNEFCKVTGRNAEDVLNEIVFEWAGMVGRREIEKATVRALALRRSTSGVSKAMKRHEPGKVVEILAKPSRNNETVLRQGPSRGPAALLSF